MDEFTKNYNYYINNHKDLFEKYTDKYIIIKSEEVVEAFDSFELAYDYAEKQFEIGTFIIQQCTKDSNEPKQIFHTRVRIGGIE